MSNNTNTKYNIIRAIVAHLVKRPDVANVNPANVKTIRDFKRVLSDNKLKLTTVTGYSPDKDINIVEKAILEGNHELTTLSRFVILASTYDRGISDIFENKLKHRNSNQKEPHFFDHASLDDLHEALHLWTEFIAFVFKTESGEEISVSVTMKEMDDTLIEFDKAPVFTYIASLIDKLNNVDNSVIETFSDTLVTSFNNMVKDLYNEMNFVHDNPEVIKPYVTHINSYVPPKHDTEKNAYDTIIDLTTHIMWFVCLVSDARANAQ